MKTRTSLPRGVEALATRLIGEALDKPCAHGPVDYAVTGFKEVVDPRIAVEIIALSLLLAASLHSAEVAKAFAKAFAKAYIDGEYLFGMVGGIQPDAPGYKRTRVQPVIREGLTWANTRYDSIQGKIVSNWKREDDKLTMAVTVLANTTATVDVPAKDAAAVTEGENAIDKAQGVKFLRMEHNAAVYAVGSGTCRFQSPLPETIR